ncbi:MAG: chemotaxis protein CheB, partial [Bacteroidota bacterium]|nr:chemotaxis protein CheB [Bacteroidota bacterium]
LSSESVGEAFLDHLNRRSVLPCAFAVHEEPIQPGRVYLAPNDNHMLLTPEKVLITRGPRENSFRPSVDTMFRSAAAAFDSRAIGIILSGMRDDGVEGLSAISRSGGITVVQDPKNAPYPDMPQAALAQTKVDYTVAMIDMGLVVADLVFQPIKENASIPEDILNEARIAERVLTSIDDVEQIGTPTPYNCPSCNGVIWGVNHGNDIHSFRCNAGHAFTQDSLLQFKSVQIEETLWACLRLLEENKRLLHSIKGASPSKHKRIAENQIYIDHLRSILLGNGNKNSTSDN